MVSEIRAIFKTENDQALMSIAPMCGAEQALPPSSTNRATQLGKEMGRGRRQLGKKEGTMIGLLQSGEIREAAENGGSGSAIPSI